MSDPAIIAVLVNLGALVVHAGLGFYWAGRIVGRLDKMEYQHAEAAAARARIEGKVESHLREHALGKWSGT